MEIYLDIVILENIVINYLILLVTSRFSKTKTNSLRLLLGSVTGTAYLVLMILLPDTQVCHPVCKIPVVGRHGCHSIHFQKNLGFLNNPLFYAATFIFAGAAFALMFSAKTGDHKERCAHHSAVFHRCEWTELLLAVALALIIFRVIWEAVQSKFVKEKLW